MIHHIPKPIPTDERRMSLIIQEARINQTKLEALCGVEYIPQNVFDSDSESCQDCVEIHNNLEKAKGPNERIDRAADILGHRYEE